MIRICKHCNSGFSTKGKRDYCDNCNLVTFTCAECGNKKTVTRQRFQRKDVAKGANKFCSTKCSIIFGNRIASQNRMNGSYIKCPNCGSENYRSVADKNRVFCNSRCYGEYRAKNPDKYIKPFNNPETVKKAILSRESRGHNGMKGKCAEKHHRWKGGKIDYRGPSWQDARAKTISRDGFLCAVCGNRAGGQVHHIIAFRTFGYVAGVNRNDLLANSTNNLISLCKACHTTAENTNNGNIPKNRLDKANKYYASLPHP